MNRRRTLIAALATVVVLIAAIPVSARERPGRDRVEHYVTGSSSDAMTNPDFGLLLAGGGTDVDEAFVEFLSLADGGDVVVIRATGADGYNDYLFELGSVDSVETLVIPDRRAAESPVVTAVLGGAELIFIAGGDQWDYVSQWSGTQVVEIIDEKVAAGVPLGGTSAGLAVLGEFLFSAKKGTVYSDEVLANPYNRYVHLDRDLVNVPMLEGVITDSHFTERDRMGRLVGFMARIIEDGWAPHAFGIGIDEATAVLVDGVGYATVIGEGSAFFLSLQHAGEIVEPRTPLTVSGITGYRISESSGSFDLDTWSGAGGATFVVDVVGGSLNISG